MYSEKVMEHFLKPRNVGEIEDADGVGTCGNPVCGDLMTFYIKVEPKTDDLDEVRITDVKFKTFGCAAAIAVASMASEMVKGKTIAEIINLSRKDIADELDGLPPAKMHCSNLGIEAIQEAIRDYLKKIGRGDLAERIRGCPPQDN
ncbi:iron-sulfur cluster assembly scaffold protein [candidate division WOR-3 bacterium]|uniref:Iron-sulfur cluster assembly scaffold protein n=1 Tax=candidate division WOR-3 bacterium TaxID=2052148 RepID=A0A660SFQ2_UNCW3|nr:MAG: iron-sulfur cluster assembly scaffold protein [candidate division WOR-3 bacterium]